jgi:SagB-type dehydrogenase family enzyme
MKPANLRLLTVWCLAGAVMLSTTAARSANTSTADLTFDPAQSIILPPPDTSGGAPLMTALMNRHSTRELRPDPLSLQTLSDLLWAANGVNRPDSGKRTAATARNWQSLDVYVVTVAGVYRYDPAAHALAPVKSGDLRAATGSQPFVPAAPLNLVYVSDGLKMAAVENEKDRALYDGAHAGIVAQNVYLYSASAGLGTVLRAMVDREALAEAMGLAASQRVVMAQTVGYPQTGP